MDHPQVNSFVTRFEKQLSSFSDFSENDIHKAKLESRFVAADGSLLSVTFGGKSPLFPDISKEHLAYWLLDYFKIELWLFKVPVKASDIHPRSMSTIQPDLKLSVSASAYDGTQFAEYYVKERQFGLFGRELASDPKNWESTGKIIGIPDLLGSQLFVIFPFERQSGADISINKYLDEIRKRFELGDLFIEFSDGHRFSFKREDFQKHVDEAGYPMFSLNFPKTSDGLLKLELRQ